MEETYWNLSMQSMPLGSSLEYTKQLKAARNSSPQGPWAMPPRQGQSQLISPVSGLKAPCWPASSSRACGEPSGGACGAGSPSAAAGFSGVSCGCDSSCCCCCFCFSCSSACFLAASAASFASRSRARASSSLRFCSMTLSTVSSSFATGILTCAIYPPTVSTHVIFHFPISQALN